MIELNGLVNPILRATERHSGLLEKRNAEAKSEEPKPTARASSRKREPAPGGEATVVNFEYVPSGRLQLNQEERQHLIDFFE